MTTIRVGIVGLGIIADRLLKSFSAHPDIQVTAVCDVDEARLQRYREQLGNVLAVTNYEELVTSSNVDLVYVAAPPSLHKRIAVAAMKAGKHVLSEKPLANSMEEAEEMQSVAKRTGVVTAMNFPLQYSKEVAEYERLVKSGFLGQLRMVELVMRFPQWPRPWQQNAWVGGRAQGGFTLEVGVHFIQSTQRIFGDLENIHSSIVYPEDAQASEVGIIATATIQGRVPVLIHGLADAGGQERIEFTAYGSDGEISLRNWGQLYKAARGEALGSVQELPETGFGGLVENVVRAIRGESAVVCDFQVGYSAQRVLEALRNP